MEASVTALHAARLLREDAEQLQQYVKRDGPVAHSYVVADIRAIRRALEIIEKELCVRA